MKKKTKHTKFNKKTVTISIFLVTFFVLSFNLYKSLFFANVEEAQLVNSTDETSVYENYFSEDLALSFSYPKNWIVQEKDLSIHLASSSKGEELSDTSRRARVDIYIKDANLCQSTIDEEFEKGGCGEVSGITKDRIKKETYNVKSGILYKYIISYTQNPQQTFYYLEKNDRLLQIAKESDPSEFNQEFEEIINSIKFL